MLDYEMNRAGLSRRQFVKGTALASFLAGLGLVGCNSAPAPDAGSAEGSAGSAEGSAAEGSAAEGSAAAGGQLLIGSEIAFAPYEWLESEESEYTLPVEGGGFCDGYDVQWAKLIAEALGKEPVFVNMSFGGLIEALNNGRVDMIISGMGDTEERRKSVAFSEPYKRDGYGLIVLADGPYGNATELADFAGASVLGQKSSPLDFCIDQIPDVVHLDPVEHVPEMLSRLAEGTCDAITCALENTPGYLETYPEFKVINPQNPALDPGFTGSCVAVRLDDTETLAVVNEVIAGVSESENQAMWDAAESRQPV